MANGLGVFATAAAKFRGSWRSYLAIPLIAAFVGWFTNYLAVQMIFYPINYIGIPLWVKDGVPLGALGWRGIVPSKAKKMSEAMVDMVTGQLLSVEEVFGRLEPKKVAKLLNPMIETIASDNYNIPKKVTSQFSFLYSGVLSSFVRDMQKNIISLCDIRKCVVEQMMEDRELLGKLFQKCGELELKFLTNSGLWFGFFLGCIQMIVALFVENPWSLSIGGAIVGFATNWLALKWIFCPVTPTKIGPFGPFQGLFLTRQKAVAKEFSEFFAKNVLTSEKLFKSILTDETTKVNFFNLLKKRLWGSASAATLIVKELPNHLSAVHPYVDKTLALQPTLRKSMEKMSSIQFERVLHPIFEEDEFTLIVAGAILGFLAGLVQQAIATGNFTLMFWKRRKKQKLPPPPPALE
ncbi:hypothetical protein TrLO_g15187 [Triparma laevis f. longispina]|uniref:DUF445 domain-containing protein n=1 Tax=Triparma laevis f. longispina TaxID=1714387 RepID=A0A9W7FP54_9STRA|nr:hypothetical protein TrLO_g15187 [Triparma laevis f. longispina]